MKAYAVDFETYYDVSYGIEEVGLWHYLNAPKFDAYLVSIYGPDIDFVGHPSNAPWSEIDGTIWLSHNAGFDQQVYNRLTDIRLANPLPMGVPEAPSAWYCTANLSVYLGGPRNLKDASKHLLNKAVDKGMRNYMKGKTWADAVAAGKDKALIEYARQDAINCWELWDKYGHLWPESERKIAELTFRQTQRGVAVDRPLLEKTLSSVYEVREFAANEIPWKGNVDESGEQVPLLSADVMRAWCINNDITPPVTCNAKDSRFMDWQKANSEVKAIKAMQTFRSSNALFMKGKTLHDRIRNDGRYGFEYKYFGATTGRWSGGWEDDHADSSQFNIQNMPKEPMYGFDLRRCLVPGAGKKFVIADFSQIEPRCLAVLSRDFKLLDALLEGMGLYEAHARATMGWTGGNLKKESPKMYALAKARVLALGYGAGWAKFIFMASMYGCDEVLNLPIENYEVKRRGFEKYIDRYNQRDKMKENPTELDWLRAVNAWLIVTDFRKTNDPITDLWAFLEHDCRRSVGTDYVVELPSGRLLKYFNIKIVGGKIMGQKQLHVPHISLWGSFITENVVQACARDVLAEAMLKLEAAGIITLFTVHDEIVCEVDKDYDMDIIKRLMIEPPTWMDNLPLDVSIEEADFYKK